VKGKNKREGRSLKLRPDAEIEKTKKGEGIMREKEKEHVGGGTVVVSTEMGQARIISGGAFLGVKDGAELAVAELNERMPVGTSCFYNPSKLERDRLAGRW